MPQALGCLLPDECVPTFVQLYDPASCTTTYRVARVGARYDGPIYSKENNVCLAVDRGRLLYYALGEEAPPPEFVEMTRMVR
jgi:hypothetical protein